MPQAPHSKELRTLSSARLTAAEKAWQKPVGSTNVPHRRRLDRNAGFWLGGTVLGLAGAIVGGCMPYHHPVAVTISVLWWGIYLGCFGASIGALLGRCAE
jgi:hypothetical protein